MGTVSSALGLGSQLEFRGKTYTLKPWTFKIQGLYEVFLQEESLRTCRKMRPFCTEEEYRELLIATRRDIDTGYYSFGQPAVEKSLSSLPHLNHLIYLMLKDNHPEVTADLVREMLEEKLTEVMDKMNEANADPNRQAGADTASPSP